MASQGERRSELRFDAAAAYNSEYATDRLAAGPDDEIWHAVTVPVTE